jgi:myo-inositol 2-dehydrogenase / D-chiro-inositol 1-dehydrogenase
MSKYPSGQRCSCTRREFLQRTAATGAAAHSALSLARSAQAAGSGTIKVGLIGCGNRGSGAALNAMNAGQDVRLVTMADIFDDRIQESRRRLKKLKPDQTTVDDDHCFFGFDAYEKLIHSGVDVVLIAAASHFHPLLLSAAIAAGKHVFCEKPFAIDVPGVRAAMAAVELAKKKNLCLASGLCWRADPGVRETIGRLRDGAIGKIVAIQETYNTTPYRICTRRPEWSEMQYQMRNWYHFNWLSGDQTAQQLIHSLDKASWALGDIPPQQAWGMGGRQVCVDPKYGDQFDHHSVVFEYADGIRVFGFCRDILGCYNECSDVILGAKGRAILPNKPQKPKIEGEKPWSYKDPKEGVAGMYDIEHQELFDAIRTGKTLNNGGYTCLSSMLAILAQMVCYTGRQITWDEAMKSETNFALPRYAWDIEPPVKPGANGQYPTAMPGITQFR